ncbi:MAG: DUF2500 family protein [Clostridia bacterium]|nr:DUF2500 family protein [Clostridia bacterium]
MLNFQDIFPAIMILAVAGFVIGIVLWARRRVKDDIASAKEEELPEPTTVYAQIIDMAVAGDRSGGKVSKYSMHFYVKFLIGANEEVIHDVPEELYESLNVGDRGTLVFFGEKFIDFVTDDSPSKE